MTERSSSYWIINNLDWCITGYLKLPLVPTKALSPVSEIVNWYYGYFAATKICVWTSKLLKNFLPWSLHLLVLPVHHHHDLRLLASSFFFFVIDWNETKVQLNCKYSLIVDPQTEGQLNIFNRLKICQLTSLAHKYDHCDLINQIRTILRMT